MPKPNYQMTIPELVGFTVESKTAGERTKVLVKTPFLISDEDDFHLYIEKIESVFLRRYGLSTESVSKFLILIHKDGQTDVYLNDNVKESFFARSTRDIKAGEKVTKNDFSNIEKLRFVDITVAPNDQVVYCVRVGWKFGLYFDFSREVKQETLENELGVLLNELFYQKSYEAAKSSAKLNNPNRSPLILTEGITDILLLKKAQRILKFELDIVFHEPEGVVGDCNLYKQCESFSALPRSEKVICMFDRDNDEIIKKLNKKTLAGKDYQSWGNNVYSFLIPIPEYRTEADKISIEFLLSDMDLMRTDQNGRRLFINTEFNKKSGRHISLDLVCGDRNKLKTPFPCIIDHEVYDNQSINVALPKLDYCEQVTQESAGFEDVDFSNFRHVFDVIQQISEI